MATSFESHDLVNSMTVRKILANKKKFATEMKICRGKKEDPIKEIEKLVQFFSGNIMSKDSPMASIPTLYKYTKGKKGTSRQNIASGTVGLQTLTREIRQTICHEYYTDIDVVNSQPTIILNYCKKAGYKCDNIQYYCDHRDDCIEQLMMDNDIDKATAKVEIISIINGGDIENSSIKTIQPWLKGFILDIESLHIKIMEHPEHIQLIQEITKKKASLSVKKRRENIVGSLISAIYFNIENTILNSCLDFVKSKGNSLDGIVLIFDGFMIPHTVTGVTDRNLSDLSAWVKKNTLYDVKFSTKPMKDMIDISDYDLENEVIEEEKEVLVANDDAEASRMLLKSIEGQCFYCEPEIWLRTRSTKIYTNKEKVIKAELKTRCADLNIMKKVGEKLVPYSANTSGSANIVDMAMAYITTSSEYSDRFFVERMIAYTKGKIFYLNGYIDMKTKARIIEDEDDTEVITPVRIGRNVPEIRNFSKETMNKLDKAVFEHIFGSEEAVNNYLQHIARAMGGYIEDKVWVILTGMRNCGKGVLTRLNQEAFDVYVSETSANNFLFEKIHTQEDPKKYAWVYQNRWVRVLHTNEIKYNPTDKSIKVDGNVIKGVVASGGDGVMSRDLYITAVKIKVQSRLFMMANDLPEISPPDAVETLTKFDFPSQFLDVQTYQMKKEAGALNKNMKEADPTIKDFVSERDACDYFLQRVLENFKEEKVINCPDVVESTLSIRADMGDDSAVLEKYFEFTKDKNDVVLSTDLSEFYKSQKLGVSINKLKQLISFSALGAIRVGNARGFSGVKLRILKDAEEKPTGCQLSS